jgi:hypothetical protein
MTPCTFLRYQISVFLLSAMTLLLIGCSADFRDLPSMNTDIVGKTPLGDLRGSAYGGQQPIYSSHVYLMAANISGYGSASTSLLHAAANTYADTTVVGTPANPAYYVVTDANGAWNITGDYTCTYNATTPSQSQLLYIYSVGGVNNYLAGQATTTGTNNPMIGLMATLGSCPSSGTFAGHLSYVYMNEISTVATAFAVAGFATSARAIGSATSSLSQLGLSNAFANANQLYDIQGSVAGHEARTRTPGLGIIGTVPQTLVNTIGNILASCVNQSNTTVPPSSGACQTIYSATGSALDTASAAIYIAQHPGSNVTSLYNLQSSSVQFADNLSSVPKDFSVGITYTGSGLSNVVDVATDALGNAWVTSSSGLVSNLTPLGAHATGSPFNVPTASHVAIDPNGGAWITSSGGNKVYGLSSAGLALAGSPLTHSNYNSPAGLAIDGNGNPFVANRNGATGFLNLNAAGDVISAATGTLFSDVNSLVGSLLNQLPGVSEVAVDGSGNVWASGDPSSCFIIFCAGSNIEKISTADPSLLGLSLTISANSGTPEGIAIDASGNGWIAVNGSSDSLLRVSSSGVSTAFSGGGLKNPQGVAVDGNGNVWIANSGGNSISAFTSAGSALTGTNGLTGGSMNAPTNLDIDLSGNLWLTNSSGNSVTEMLGIAAPTIRPLSSAVSLNKLATKP